MKELRNRLSQRRGMVLIVVLSVLAVLAILGVSLLSLNSLDKRISTNWLAEVQARLIARAGVEDSAARLRDGYVLRTAFDADIDWMYFGKDTAQSDPNLRTVSLAQATRPSFAAKKADGTPEQIMIKKEDGSVYPIGYSGTMPGKDAVHGGVYSLEVRDLSSCIYVNDGIQLYGGNNSSVSQNLRRILNVLGQHPSVNLPNLGDTVVTARPARGFASWQDFKTIVKRQTGWSDAQFSRAERYLTTSAWVDKNVCNPVPLSEAVLSSYAVKFERGSAEAACYRRGPGKNHKNDDRAKNQRLSWRPDSDGQTGIGGTTSRVYGHDELNPTYIEIVHRAPVNINTAEEPVLVALLANLRGFYMMEKRTQAPINYGPSSMDYTATQWQQGNVQFNVPRGNYTWEYMGHTYDNEQWPAQTRVVEPKKWNDPLGGVSSGVQRDTRLTQDHDELGELWITPSINVGSGETVTEGVSARAIAQEIIACRSRTGNYQNSPVGGPFKSWAQFNEFVDGLMLIRKDGAGGRGILHDTRFTDAAEQRQADQALADMLKANFNPNFHANELNPDHNIYGMIDKTDLVVNSTEFCFLPTGYFQVNSVGRILRDVKKADGSGAHGGGPSEIVAQAKIQTLIRAHELYRETNQRHFYFGESPLAADSHDTANGKLVAMGPEPDNGPLVYGEHLNGYTVTTNPDKDGWAAYGPMGKASEQTGWGYEADGYLVLPTVGGEGRNHARNTLESTVNDSNCIKGKGPAGTVCSTLHAHFGFDDRLHTSTAVGYQSSDVYRENMATLTATGNKEATTQVYVYNPATCSGSTQNVKVSVISIEQHCNFADQNTEGLGPNGEVILSPYDPTDGSRFRVHRSFRPEMNPAMAGAAAASNSTQVSDGSASNGHPPFAKVPPCDLRADGFYAERHAGLAYWIDESMDGAAPTSPPNPQGLANFYSTHGTVAFWFKPNFDPAYSGKIRSLVSASRIHRKNYFYRNPSPFTLYFFPSHSDPSNAPTAYTGTFNPSVNSTSPANGWPIAGRLAGCNGLTRISKASLVFNVGFSQFDGAGWDNEYMPPTTTPAGSQLTAIPNVSKSECERYAATPTLNSKVTTPAEQDKDGLRARRWTHVSMAWAIEPNTPGGETQSLGIMLNGKVPGGTVASQNKIPGNYQNTYAQMDAIPTIRAKFAMQSFTDHQDPEDLRWYMDASHEFSNRAIANTIRFGEVSTASFGPNNEMPRNYSSDGTYDEIYVWTMLKNDARVSPSEFTNPMGTANRKYHEGRYFVPATTGIASTWTSPELSLKQGSDRELAPPSSMVATGSEQVSAPKIGGNATQAEGSKNGIRIFGLSWTWYAEKYVAGQIGNTGTGAMSMIPVMVDYRNSDMPLDLRQVKSCARLSLKSDGQTFPMNDTDGLGNDAYSALQDSNGYPIVLGKDGKFQYQVKFVVEGATQNPIAGTVLLTSPIFDDVTIFYEGTPIKFLEYFQTVGIE